MKRYVVVAVGVVLVLALGVGAREAVAGSHEVEAAIQKLREMEAAAVNEANTGLAAKIYTEDVEYLPPGEAALKGPEAVQQWLAGFLEQMDAQLEYTDSKLIVAGDVAVEQYAAKLTATPKAGGESMTEHVRGVHVYRRAEDGSWKISHDIWNYAAAGE